MKILIVSDTHGNHRNLDDVIEREGDSDWKVSGVYDPWTWILCINGYAETERRGQRA